MKNLHRFNPQDTVEVSVHRFVADASDLGIAPGPMPSVLEAVTLFGNGRPLYRVACRSDGLAIYHNATEEE